MDIPCCSARNLDFTREEEDAQDCEVSWADGPTLRYRIKLQLQRMDAVDIDRLRLSVIAQSALHRSSGILNGHLEFFSPCCAVVIKLSDVMSLSHGDVVYV